MATGQDSIIGLALAALEEDPNFMLLAPGGAWNGLVPEDKELAWVTAKLTKEIPWLNTGNVKYHGEFWLDFHCYATSEVERIALEIQKIFHRSPKPSAWTNGPFYLRALKAGYRLGYEKDEERYRTADGKLVHVAVPTYQFFCNRLMVPE